MPALVELHIPLKKQSMRAKVDWRDGDEMGVSFIEAAPGAPIASAHGAELTQRVLKLEGEIADFRKILERLRVEVSPNQDLTEAR
jgi:hypothetical protein